MKNLLSWLKVHWAYLLVFIVFIAVNIFYLLTIPSPLATGPIEDRFTLYEDQDNKVDCYILDEGKSNQTMACIKQVTPQP